MSEYTLLDIDLRLFDGEGGDGAAAPGDGSAQGETMARPASTRRGKTGEYSNVLSGRGTLLRRKARAVHRSLPVPGSRQRGYPSPPTLWKRNGKRTGTW